MSQENDDIVTRNNKITILLAEYSSLRTEIMTRTTHIYQIIAAFVFLTVWMLGKPVAGYWFILLVVAVAYFFFIIARDIGKAAARLQEIEKDINARAGEQLLVWETFSGGAKTGYFGRAKPLERPKIQPPKE